MCNIQYYKISFNLPGDLYSCVTCLKFDVKAATQSGPITLCHLINWDVTSQMPLTQCWHMTANEATKCDAENYEIGAQRKNHCKSVFPILIANLVRIYIFYPVCF